MHSKLKLKKLPQLLKLLLLLQPLKAKLPQLLIVRTCQKALKSLLNVQMLLLLLKSTQLTN
jgi:hypothetical protein